MERYFKLLFVALFVTMSLTLTSCSDDDEPDANNCKGELTIDGKKYSFDIMMDDVDDDTFSCSVWNSKDEDHMLMINIYEWSSANKNTVLTFDNFEVTWNHEDGVILGHPTADGATKIVSKDSKGITLQFNNATFEDVRGYESFTVNGTITLPIE